MGYSELANLELKKFGYDQQLLRSLSIWQLVAFGLTYLQPIGPAVVFGLLLTTSKGTVALSYLVAFIGMLFTIQSYTILIKEYPLSGSIYNYVKLITGPRLGFISGWLLALDYVLIPTITSVCAATYAHHLIPAVRYELWLLSFILAMGILNILGMRLTSYFSCLVLIVQLAIVIMGFLFWTKYIHSSSSLLSLEPFHFSSISGLIQAGSIAIFSFLGFDAITTLAEESVNPKKDIPSAMMLCAGIGFIIMFITGYLGVLMVPDWKHLSSSQEWVNTVLFNLASISGGHVFAFIYAIGFILAMVVTNLVGTTSSSRLLFSMGRDGIISKKLFANTNDKYKTPLKNIVFIIIIQLILGHLSNQDQLAELINFGAVTGFIMLNFSVIFLWFKLNNYKSKYTLMIIIRYLVFPCLGVIVMLLILINMKHVTLIFGSIWAFIGFLYYSLKVNTPGISLEEIPR